MSAFNPIVCVALIVPAREITLAIVRDPRYLFPSLADRVFFQAPAAERPIALPPVVRNGGEHGDGPSDTSFERQCAAGAAMSFAVRIDYVVAGAALLFVTVVLLMAF
jgi:hypothetical protein